MTDLIADLPRDERPRERMMIHGIDTLSNAELLALLLGSGARGKNAIQLARELLRQGVAALSRAEGKELIKTSGVGPAKAARIAAAFEFARRVAANEPEEPPMFELEAVGPTLVTRYGAMTQERLGAIFLDSRDRILQQREIYIGTINTALVSTRDIIRFAVLDCATAVVIYHNHPSGVPTPSPEDLSFTQKLKQSLGHCDIELADHVIIAGHRYHSMKQRGEF